MWNQLVVVCKKVILLTLGVYGYQLIYDSSLQNNC